MEKFMKLALELAAEFSGFTSPNPLVGAVVVKNGEIVGSGAHEKCGEAHAEVIALNKAGSRAENATLYVTLEPCNHYGETPPCTDLIISHKISKVVCAMQDPNPLVSGRGFAKLRNAGIEVVEGVLQNEAEQLNEIFIKNITEKKPFIILKSAITLDGKIATGNNDAKWISNSLAGEKVHEIRNSVDAIIVGKNTFVLDNPSLNVRLDKPVSDPYKVILSNSFDIDISTIINSKAYKLPSEKPLIICTSKQDISAEKLKEFAKQQIIVINHKKKNLEDLLGKLLKMGIYSILLEGGSGIYTSFIKEKLVDKIILFQAPKIIGDDGISWMRELHIKSMQEAITFQNIASELIGDNIMITIYPQKQEA